MRSEQRDHIGGSNEDLLDVAAPSTAAVVIDGSTAATVILRSR
jgi:hypothetical protein